MQRFQIFWHNLQQDLKIFLYFIILFSVFRLAPYLSCLLPLAGYFSVLVVRLPFKP